MDYFNSSSQNNEITISEMFDNENDAERFTKPTTEIVESENETEWSTNWNNVSNEVITQLVTLLSQEDTLEKGLLSWDDATWILTSAFIIFTMQSGFGLLEAGCVSYKNEVNIMVKNAVDVVFGGLAYWMFGYGFQFGEGKFNNAFIGWGSFFVDGGGEKEMGLIYSNFIFQLSFATTATTIVSGAMAERTKLSAYIIFSFMNTLVYCIPAHWIWASKGFLNTLGAVDIAGSGGVHLCGGVSALIATILLKPRLGRYTSDTTKEPSMGNATNVMVGMFMLWWGWLGFNCGSTFGISYGKWKLAAKSAVNTICSTMGGGALCIFFGSSVTTIAGSLGGGSLGISFSYWWRRKRYDVKDITNSILGSLVAITAGCAVIHPWEAIVIGAIGSLISILSTDLLNKLKIDDPVGAVAVHGFCGIWGLLAVGLFVEDEPVMKLNNGQLGLFKGGGFYSLGVQLLVIVSVTIWAAVVSFVILSGIRLTNGLRLSEYEEIMGSDFIEHGIEKERYEERLPGSCQCTCNGVTRSSFGFTRSMVDVISPVGILQATVNLRSRPSGVNGRVNKALELPTITEGLKMFHGKVVENGLTN